MSEAFERVATPCPLGQNHTPQRSILALHKTTRTNTQGADHGWQKSAAAGVFRSAHGRSDRGCDPSLGLGIDGRTPGCRCGDRPIRRTQERRAHHLRRPALARLRFHGPRAPPHAASRPAGAGESRLPVWPRAQQPLLPEPRLDHHRPAAPRAPDRRQRSARGSARGSADSAHWPGRPGRLHRRPRSDEPAPRGMAAPAAAPGRTRLRKPADRQVVARRLFPRRVYRGHVEGEAARR